MWHGAQEQFAEHHAFDAEVLRVFCFAGYLAAKIGWCEIFS
jgi:hypothetical protein